MPKYIWTSKFSQGGNFLWELIRIKLTYAFLESIVMEIACCSEYNFINCN